MNLPGPISSPSARTSSSKTRESVERRVWMDGVILLEVVVLVVLVWVDTLRKIVDVCIVSK